MLSKYLLDDITLYIKNKVKSAEVTFENQEPKKLSIMRKEISNDILKIYINTSLGVGNIIDIKILDDEGNVLITKPTGIIKTVDHAIISTFWIKVIEDEVLDPINIFEVQGGINGK